MKSVFIFFSITNIVIAAMASPLPPLVQVTQAPKPPVIDGTGGDPAWEHTIAIQDFIVPASHRPASEGAEVRMMWDESHLYLSARLRESVLSLSSQQQHEIKAEATERDGKVVNDDSFLLFLRPEQSPFVFEFAINTRGIVADAKSSASDPWGSRDLGWNAAFHSAVSVGDGYWIAELAIPWKELGVEAPKLGAQWEVAVARHAAARHETASWNRSGPGIHAPEQWGILRFGGETPGARLIEPFSRLEPGKNQLRCVFIPSTNDPENLLVSTEIASGGAPPTRSRTTLPVAGSEPIQAMHDYAAKDARGDVTFSWMISDAASLEPLYRSPGISTEILASGIALHLTTESPYRLLVNGIPVAKGNKANGEFLKISLRTGVNTLALETQSGVAKVKLESPDLGSAPIRWKIRKASDPDALRAESDDSDWQTAPEDDRDVTGLPGAPAVLRHTILLQGTRIFPAPIPALYIAGKGIQPVTFTAFGAPGLTLRDWKVYLELPKSVEAIGCTGYYGERGGKPKFSLRHEAPARYSVEADKPIVPRAPGSPFILSVFDVALRQSNGAPRPDGSTPVMRHYGRANDDTVSELAQNTTIELVGDLLGHQPRKVRWQLWGNYFSSIDNREISQAILETARLAGFNNFVGTIGNEGVSYGISATQQVSFRTYSLNLNPWLKLHPEARLVDAQGKPSDSLMCTTVLLENGWREAGAPLLKEWWGTRGVETINYDFEYTPFDGPHSCFCSRCLKEFCTKAKISGETPVAAILESHRAEWVDFMAHRVAEVFLQMKNTVRELPGDVQFEVYSGYQTPDNPVKYGVNWAYVGELKAADRAGVGYGRPVPGTRETVDALRGIPVMFGELVTPYMGEPSRPLDFTKPGAPVSKAALLRRSIDSTGGVLVYHTQNMDGRSWYAIAETTRLIADHEALFIDPQPESIPGQSPVEVQLLRGTDGALLCIMNLQRANKAYSIPLPAEFGDAREFYTGATVKAGGEIKVNLRPGETAVYLSNKNRKP